MTRVSRSGWILLALALLAPAPLAAAPIVFSVGGDNTAASIQATVDAFRVVLGDPLNGNTPGPLPAGRREINWDGGGATNSVQGATPFDVFFNSRGGRFETPGTGFVQGSLVDGGDPANVTLGEFFANAAYDTTFGTFSPTRVFVPIDSTVTDALFFVPGASPVPATVTGFGAVFSDVDLADTTRVEFFNALGHPLFSTFVAPGTVPDGSLSFLGVLFDAGERIGSIRITTGNAALGPGVADGGSTDLVVMDDFLYSEPQAVPEPGTLVLMGAALAAAFSRRRLRAR
jgi:hypothetical protein